MWGKWDKVHFANGATYGTVWLARTLLTVDDYYMPPTASTSSSSNDSRRPPGESSISPESTHTREPAPIDVEAVEDTRRLAAKVQRQQGELGAKSERIQSWKPG